LVGAWLVFALLDQNHWIEAEKILEYLNVVEFCSLILVAERTNFTLSTISKKVLRHIIYKNSDLFSWVLQTETRLPIFQDAHTLWTYHQPNLPEEAFDFETLINLSASSLLKFYKETSDLSKKQTDTTKWIFDSITRPQNYNNIIVEFNPKYPCYILRYLGIRNVNFHFSLHLHPIPLRNARGQDLFYRSADEIQWVSNGHTSTHWSPNGEYLAVIDRYYRSTVTFYRYFPSIGVLRRIKNLSFHFETYQLLSHSLWFDNSSFLLPDPSNDTLFSKISFKENNSYSIDNVPNYLKSKIETKFETSDFFYGIIPDKDLLFYVVPCYFKNHQHDCIYFSKVGSDTILAKISLLGIITSYCITSSELFFMIRGHSQWTFINGFCDYVLETTFNLDECAFSDLLSRTNTTNYKQKLHKFIGVHTEFLIPRLLKAYLVLSINDDVNSDRQSQRMSACAKNSRLTSSKFYLCFHYKNTTYFISKSHNITFQTSRGNFKFCHPKEPLFASVYKTCTSIQTKFYLQNSANQTLKTSLPKKTFHEYNKPIEFKQVM